jgi:hypothetical protein
MIAVLPAQHAQDRLDLPHAACDRDREFLLPQAFQLDGERALVQFLRKDTALCVEKPPANVADCAARSRAQFSQHPIVHTASLEQGRPATLIRPRAKAENES